MKNAHKEAWDFGHPGWLNERASGFITAPVKENLKFEVLAWTPSTKGTVTGSAIQLIAAPRSGMLRRRTMPRRGRGGRADAAVRNSLARRRPRWIVDRRKSKNSVRGKMVMIGKAAVIPVDFNPPQKRLPDDATPPVDEAAATAAAADAAAPDNDGRLTARQVTDAIDTMLLANGALVRINDAARGQGIIVAQQHPNYDPEQDRAHRHPAQRRLRPHRAPARRQRRREARVQH